MTTIEAICTDCTAKRGSRIPDGHLPTFWGDRCDVCGEAKPVTAPRDYRPRPDVLRIAEGKDGRG